MKCINCGADIAANSRFCNICGSPTNVSTDFNNKDIRNEEHNTERKQEYVGKILKCPHCGSTITETMAVCQSCGMHITGKTAISSVREFETQLMEIERSRERKNRSLFGAGIQAADTVDMQKLTLIRNFPIPNSVSDCMEFMMLAIANIDVRVSKNTLMNKFYKIDTTENRATIHRVISDAWVAKMEQVYRKAEVAFPDDPAFAKIQEIYFNKMRELNLKVR